MRKRGYRIGPGAASLLLIIVILCLTVMGLLSLMSARADYKLSERNAQMVAAYYAADEAAQTTLAQLDALLLDAGDAPDEEAFFAHLEENLPEDMPLDEDSRTVAFSVDAGDDRALTVTVEILYPADGAERYVMRSMVLSDEMPWETLYYEEMM